MRAAAVSIALVLASGCATPAFPDMRWRESDPVVRPLQSPDRESRGRLVVKTQCVESLISTGDTSARFRGYRLYDEEGRLLYASPGSWEPEDVRWLRPGRYIAVAPVRKRFLEFHDIRIQFSIESHETTIVDLTRVTESTTSP